MMEGQVDSYRAAPLLGVALLLVLGGVVLSAPATARTRHNPCVLVSVSETEALAGEKVVKSVESPVPHKKGNGTDIEGANSVCKRWLASGRLFLLTVGDRVTAGTKVESVGDVLGRQAQAKIGNAGGTWELKQFGEIACTMVVVPSNPGLDTTTCGAEKHPLYYGDGFDGTALFVKKPLLFTLQISAGPDGRTISMDRVHALAAKVLARIAW